jgi:hypothetical protein
MPEKGRSVKKLRELDVKTVRTGLAVLIVLVVAVILAVNLLGGSGSSGEESPGTAVALSESELISRVSELERPAYWVGARPGTAQYELTSTADGRIYIRYLTGDAKAGDPRPDFLTVGTYPVPEAQKALRVAENSSTGMTLSKHVGYQTLSGETAHSAYVVFDNEPNVQIEIFSPTPGESSDLANSGALTPMD